MESRLTEGLKGRRVFFEPLRGNHGDKLIRLAAQQILKAANVELVSQPERAEVILLNGGGAMTEGWFGLKSLTDYCSRFSQTPIVVWPSSFHFPTTNLADILRQNEAGVTLWARERRSQELLKEAGLPSHTKVELEHDLVFGLDLSELIPQSESSGLLVVERDDWEGPTGRKRPLAIKGLEVIPQSVRTAVRRTILGPLRKRRDKSDFAVATVEFALHRHPELAGQPVDVGDVSLAEVCDFQQFLNRIAQASVIVSTRLHVAILGYLLNKPTYLVDGTYHKYRGVYEHSLVEGSVEFVRWCEESKSLIR